MFDVLPSAQAFGHDFWLTLDLYKCGSQGILLSVCGSNSDVCAGLVED